MNTIFLNSITKLQVYYNLQVEDLKIRNKSVRRPGTLFKRDIIKEVYRGIFTDAVPLDEYLTDYMNSEKIYFKDDVFYYKPHCDLSLNDGTLTTVFFNSKEELDTFVKDLQNKLPHITI